MAKFIPEGTHTLTPDLPVKDAARMIEFYKRAFGATEVSRAPSPDGKIMHAALKIGDSTFYLSDEFPNGCPAPTTLGGSTCVLSLYVEDADKLFKQAVSAGAKVKMPIMDAFWGDRYGQVTDPSGHIWAIATHQRDLSPQEIEKGAREFFTQMSR